MYRVSVGITILQFVRTDNITCILQIRKSNKKAHDGGRSGDDTDKTGRIKWPLVFVRLNLSESDHLSLVPLGLGPQFPAQVGCGPEMLSPIWITPGHHAACCKIYTESC